MQCTMTVVKYIAPVVTGTHTTNYTTTLRYTQPVGVQPKESTPPGMLFMVVQFYRGRGGKNPAIL